MEILVTGASGVLGSRVATVATERGHTVRRLSRAARNGDGWLAGDLTTGEGVVAAVEGADAVIHCATDPRHHRTTDLQGTRTLLEAAEAVGRPHIVYPGIVGSDIIPLGYYRSKTAAEQLLEQASCPTTIQRYTQFHDLVWSVLTRLTKLPLVPLPNDTRFQVLDATAAARHLVAAAEDIPAGRLPDLGGPTIYEVRDLARSVANALGRSRRFLRINAPGLVGAAFRSGANLTENRDDSGATWNAFVESRLF